MVVKKEEVHRRTGWMWRKVLKRKRKPGRSSLLPPSFPPSPILIPSIFQSMAPKHIPPSFSSWWQNFARSALRSKHSFTTTTLSPDSIEPSSLHSEGIPSTSSSSREALQRRLGVIDLILLGIGASIGAGIFVVTGSIANDTGPGTHSFNFPNLWVLWFFQNSTKLLAIYLPIALDTHLVFCLFPRNSGQFVTMG